MFAGIPGIGVGTLFYVITALWMPIPECVRLFRGTSSRARWRLIAVQFGFAVSIIASIAVAERVMLWALGASSPRSVNPARLLNEGFASASPETLLAAPIIASLVLLAAVLIAVQVLRLRHQFARYRAGRVIPTRILSDSPYGALTDRQQSLADS